MQYMSSTPYFIGRDVVPYLWCDDIDTLYTDTQELTRQTMALQQYCVTIVNYMWTIIKTVNWVNTECSFFIFAAHLPSGPIYSRSIERSIVNIEWTVHLCGDARGPRSYIFRFYKWNVEQVLFMSAESNCLVKRRIRLRYFDLYWRHRQFIYDHWPLYKVLHQVQSVRHEVDVCVCAR